MLQDVNVIFFWVIIYHEVRYFVLAFHLILLKKECFLKIWLP